MSTPVFHRRRVRRFAQLLDNADDGRHSALSTTDRELADLAALGRRIATVPPPGEVDPRFRADLRTMLMAVAAREGIGKTASTAEAPAPKPARPSRRARTRSIVVLGVAVGAITVSGISAASEDSLPGDALYPMKRTAERAQLAVATEANRGRLHIEFAQTRLFEAQAVQDRPEDVASLLDDMDAQTREAVRVYGAAAVQQQDDAPLDTLAAFVAEQRRQLTTMLNEAPDVRRERLAASLSLLDAVDDRIAGLRADLACDAEPSEEFDALGPVPAGCVVGG